MPLYLHQFKYKDDHIRRMLSSEEEIDREEVIREATGAFKGKLHGFYFCFGEYDGVAITEFPSEMLALACAVAIFGQGRVKALDTTPLITASESVKAFRLAQDMVHGRGTPAQSG